MNEPRPADPDLWIPAAQERTRQTLEHTVRVFRTLAPSARAAGDVGRAARFERLAQEVERRLSQHSASSQRFAEAQRRRGRTATRVLLVDDHELARQAMRSVLAREQGFHIVGEAVDGQQAVRLAQQLKPELVLMDVRLPGMDGLAATRALLAQMPGTRVVILTSYDQRAILLEGLRAGAAGVLLKGATKQEVLSVVRAVLAGEHRVQDALTAELLKGHLHSPEPGSPPTLSQRELDVVRLIAHGNSNIQIAETLHVSLNTVKSHVRHILRRLDAPNRASAVAHAVVWGLLTESPPAGL